MGLNYRKLSVKNKTYELVLECVIEYRKHHKEFDQIPISQNKIIYEMALFYLKDV